MSKEYQTIFGLLTPKDCPPYETDYCPQTFSVYRSQEMADVAGYYNAFGVAPSPERPERPDHVSLELEFMGWLVAKEIHALHQSSDEHRSVCREAQKSFAERHLCWWIPAFANALSDKTKAVSPTCTFYALLGHMLPAFIAAERRLLGVPSPTRLAAPTPMLADEPGAMSCADCASELGLDGLFAGR